MLNTAHLVVKLCSHLAAHLQGVCLTHRRALQALPLALAAAKDAKGYAYKEALELLLDILNHVDNSGNIYDADNAVAAILEALGKMRAAGAEVCPMPALVPPCSEPLMQKERRSHAMLQSPCCLDGADPGMPTREVGPSVDSLCLRSDTLCCIDQGGGAGAAAALLAARAGHAVLGGHRGLRRAARHDERRLLARR